MPPIARTRLDGMLAKVETVYGTDATPVAGTDGVQLDERLWANITVDFLEANSRDNAHSGRLSPSVSGPPSGRWVKVEVTAVLKGAGVAYAAGQKPEIHPLLQGCGYSAAVTTTAGSEKWTYTPADSAQDSLTLYCYAAGSLFKVVGARGALSLDATAAKLGMVKMTFFGLMASGTNPSDVALPSITYPRLSVIAPPVAGNTLTLNAVGVSYNSAVFDGGAEITAAPRGNAADGHAGYEVTSYSPTLKVTLDSPSKASLNPWALQAAGTPFAWSVTVGTAQYNRATIAGANAQFSKLPPQDDSGFAMLATELRLSSTAALPSHTIVFD